MKLKIAYPDTKVNLVYVASTITFLSKKVLLSALFQRNGVPYSIALFRQLTAKVLAPGYANCDIGDRSFQGSSWKP